MANTSKIRGFIPVKHLTGAPYNGQANIYATSASDGTALFVGDTVKILTDANAQGIQYVTAHTAGTTTVGEAAMGVVVGVINTKLDPVGGTMSAGSISLDTPQYRPASTAQYVLVADSPDIVYEVETGNSTVTTGSNFAVASVGLNANVIAGAGSTVTGTSGYSLDCGTTGMGTTATLPFKILGVVQRPDNEKTGNYTKVLVKINNHQYGSATGTAGV